ncbi:MAG: hypothetical protein ACE363_00215 [Alphaproteobacteria bacterium]
MRRTALQWRETGDRGLASAGVFTILRRLTGRFSGPCPDTGMGV